MQGDRKKMYIENTEKGLIGATDDLVIEYNRQVTYEDASRELENFIGFIEMLSIKKYGIGFQTKENPDEEVYLANKKAFRFTAYPDNEAPSDWTVNGFGVTLEKNKVIIQPGYNIKTKTDPRKAVIDIFDNYLVNVSGIEFKPKCSAQSKSSQTLPISP
jgi:hypothetical protein